MGSLTQPQIENMAAQKVPAVDFLTGIEPPDVGKAALEIDTWLRAISKDLVTLDRVKTVAGSLPVVGNIMALLDVLCDVIAITNQKAEAGAEAFFNWVSLGVNVIGVIPLPPAMAPMRMSLRPMLHLMRQKLKSSAHDIGEAVIVMLVEHLNATIAGEIDKFVDEATAKLGEMLGSAGDKSQEIARSWSGGLKQLAQGKLLAVGAAPEKPRYDPQSGYLNFFGAAYGALDAGAKRQVRQMANEVFAAAIESSGASDSLMSNAKLIDALGAQVKGKLKEQGDAGTAKSIAWLLAMLKRAVALSKGKKGAATLPPAKGTHYDAKKGEGQLGVVSHQKTKCPDGNCWKKTGGGKAPAASAATPRAISFATGSETLLHTDFALPGLMPIVWSRLYCSRLGAFDHPLHAGSQSAAPSYLGARWTTAYTTRIEQAEDGGLTYFAADGRGHQFPKLAGPQDGRLGQTHHNPIEDLTLGRGHDGLLILSHGRHYVETFELAPQFVANGKAVTRKKAVFYRLTSQRERAGHTTELAYRHPGGQLSDITSGQTHVSTAVDAQGRIQSLWLVEDAVAVRQLAHYTYEDQPDGSSDLIAAQDEHQDGWNYEYLQAAGKPGEPGEPGNSASTHLITRYTDRTARAIHLEWMHAEGFAQAITPTNSALAKAYRERADDGSFATTMVWNRHIRLTTVIDALGAQTQYYYDILGYTYRIVYPGVTEADGRVYEHEEWFMRDAAKNITRHVHPDGSVERYVYDAHGNLSSHTRADGSTVHFAHDALDNVTGIRDAEGQRWERSYDGLNLVEEVDPLGHTTQYTYDKDGLPVEITDAKGGKKQLAYNAAGQLTAYTDCSGKTTKWTYDERGRLLKAANAAGEATTYQYERGNLAVITHPDATKEHLEHDAEGRLLLHRDALHRETRYRYSDAGLIAQRTDANRHTLQYQWDLLGRLATLQNENARTHRFEYDPLGKLVGETSFDDSRTEYLYTPASGVLRQIQEANSLTQVDFDAMGRLTGRKVGLYGVAQDGSEGRTFDPASIELDTYAYDGNGHLTDAKNANIHLQWFHDAVGNTTTEHHHYRIDAQGNSDAQPMTAVWQHRYDEIGTRIQTTRPDGHTTRWLTYGSGHVHGLMLDDMEALQIERDDLHRETKRTQANQIAEERQYDPAGRLKAQILSRAERLSQSAGSTAFAPSPMSASATTTAFSLRRTYRYDPGGQLTDIGDSRRGNLNYHYDPVGRLLEAHSPLGTETFAFDPASNLVDPQAQGRGASSERVKVHGIPAVLDNLLRDYAGTHFDYDARGNMVKRIHHGQVTHLRWSAGNQLLEVTEPGIRTTRYHYDPLGRRIAKHSAPLGHRHGAADTTANRWGATLFGWDGDQMAWEADYARRLTVHYIFEPDSFVPLLQASSQSDIRKMFLQRPEQVTTEYIDEDGNYDIDRDPLYNGDFEPGDLGSGHGVAPLEHLHYYQCDHLGTPMELTDQDGNIAWEASYKAWGEAKITISEAARKAQLKNPIRFQGQYFDEESGLHYNRFRYYDPVVGRFLSKDPVSLAGGINLHQYAPNPIDWIDPLGLSAASDLPPLKGGSVPHVKNTITAAGFSRTSGNTHNEKWNNPDGSEVRIHQHGNQNLTDRSGNLAPKSGLNAHVHKECPLKNQLDDRGQPSVNLDETHIGIKNPKTLPAARGRRHGDGSS